MQKGYRSYNRLSASKKVNTKPNNILKPDSALHDILRLLSKSKNCPANFQHSIINLPFKITSRSIFITIEKVNFVPGFLKKTG
ncbi:MAG: hypothetical protein EOM06_05450 [Sphingobacteriia bacterium]|nr:hypothetical protein [Sphingobacteriia bacterium]